MAAPTNYYVDPGSGDDATGDGSSGNPWATVQYALNNITRDTTSGDQINVKSGTTDVLSAELNTTTYGTASLSAQLTIRGYTSTANDGGKGSISGGGLVEIWNEPAKSYINFIDMELTEGSGTNPIRFGNYCSVIRCEIHNQSNGVRPGTYCKVDGCNFHNISTYGINSPSTGTQITNNYFTNGASSFTSAIYMAGAVGCVIKRNIISIDGATTGMDVGSTGCYVANNSILSSSGTGTGIDCVTSSYATIINNIIEGFSGAGGIGIVLESSITRRHLTFRGNAVYNCTTNYSNISSKLVVEQDPEDSNNDNEELGSSPFAKTGSDTFDNRFEYFALNDVGNVREGAYVAQ